MTWLDRHLDEQALLMFHYHQLEPETYQRLATHLEECVSCRQELDRLEQILVQSPAPALELGASDQSGFWIRMRRRRRLRRIRRAVLALALLTTAAALLLWRYPQWRQLQPLRHGPATEQAARVPVQEPSKPFDLPLDTGWLQRYLPAAPEPPAEEAGVPD